MQGTSSFWRHWAFHIEEQRGDVQRKKLKGPNSVLCHTSVIPLESMDLLQIYISVTEQDLTYFKPFWQPMFGTGREEYKQGRKYTFWSCYPLKLFANKPAAIAPISLVLHHGCVKCIFNCDPIQNHLASSALNLLPLTRGSVVHLICIWKHSSESVLQKVLLGNSYISIFCHYEMTFPPRTPPPPSVLHFSF